jgi:hypothetical protein
MRTAVKNELANPKLCNNSELTFNQLYKTKLNFENRSLVADLRPSGLAHFLIRGASHKFTNSDGCEKSASQS